MDTSNRLNWLVAIIGVWEVISPFILGYNGVAVIVWNAVIIGLAVILFSIWSALTTSPGAQRGLDWINVILGLWLIVSPFILGFSTMLLSTWDAIIVGIVVAVLEIWAALSVPAAMRIQDRS